MQKLRLAILAQQAAPPLACALGPAFSASLAHWFFQDLWRPFPSHGAALIASANRRPDADNKRWFVNLSFRAASDCLLRLETPNACLEAFEIGVGPGCREGMDGDMLWLLAP